MMEATLDEDLTAEQLRVTLDEARAHQRAAAKVLKVISEAENRSQPVFDAIAEAAAELCGAAYCNIQVYDGEKLHVVATHNFPPDVLEKFMALYPARPDPNRNSGQAFLNRKVSIIEDLQADPNYPIRDIAQQGSWRAHMSVPIWRGDEAVGLIGVARPEPTVFSKAQIRILETFADQALIAIDNAKLFERLEVKSQELLDLNRTLEERVLKQVAELERVGRLRRFLPRQLADLVINTGDESILESHRSEVTVVFCDLRGFTAFSEVAEPEEVTTVLGDYHRIAGAPYRAAWRHFGALLG